MNKLLAGPFLLLNKSIQTIYMNLASVDKDCFCFSFCGWGWGWVQPIYAQNLIIES